LLKVLWAIQIPKRFPTYEGDYYGDIRCRRTLKLLCGVVTWSFVGLHFNKCVVIVGQKIRSNHLQQSLGKRSLLHLTSAS
ncbi:hypothetical protein T08_14020, partial [Trichinella sp. T8]